VNDHRSDPEWMRAARAAFGRFVFRVFVATGATPSDEQAAYLRYVFDEEDRSYAVAVSRLEALLAPPPSITEARITRVIGASTRSLREEPRAPWDERTGPLVE
jgi:hypothetical protein